MWLRGHSTSFQCILTAPRFVLLAADELLGSRAMCALGVVDFLEAVVRLAELAAFPVAPAAAAQRQGEPYTGVPVPSLSFHLNRVEWNPGRAASRTSKVVLEQDGCPGELRIRAAKASAPKDDCAVKASAMDVSFLGDEMSGAAVRQLAVFQSRPVSRLRYTQLGVFLLYRL
jgi:hypothetical protein